MISTCLNPYPLEKQKEIEKRILPISGYYANVIIWTLIFTLPVTFLFDIILLPSSWFLATALRISTMLIGLYIFRLKERGRVSSSFALHSFSAAFLYTAAFLCVWVPDEISLIYFILLSVFTVFINAVAIQHPFNSLIQAIGTLLVLILVNAFIHHQALRKIRIERIVFIYSITAMLSCAITAVRFRRTIKKIICETQTSEAYYSLSKRRSKQDASPQYELDRFT